MAKQGVDFAGLENGNIHPSDIDAVLEFDNEVLILIEIKREGNPLTTGQRLLLERICDSWHTGKCVVIFANHKFYNTDVDVPATECTVRGMYYSNKWHKVDMNLKDVLNHIGIKWNINKLKF